MKKGLAFGRKLGQNRKTVIDLAKTIKTRRGHLGLTYRGLAARSGLETSTIRAIEKGRTTNPNASTRAALERGLELPEGSLFGDAPPSPTANGRSDSQPASVNPADQQPSAASNAVSQPARERRDSAQLP